MLIKMLLLLFLLLCSMADTARILCVFPTPAISHQVVFRALTMELEKRGHELVIITPDPVLPTNRTKGNITEISTKRSYDNLKKLVIDSSKRLPQRGVIYHIETIVSFKTMQYMSAMMLEVLEFEEVKKVIYDKTQKFDLVIVETFSTYYYILGKIFNAPLITFSSYYGYPEIFEVVGAVSRHPILHPNFMRNKFGKLSFLEKITEVYNEYRIMRSFAKLEEYGNKFLKSKFGEDAPTASELKNLVSMVFLNSFPIFDNNRPVPPNVVYLGALHLQPVKELPKDLKDYLDNSKRGVVYVSLGTNVRSAFMDKDLMYAFADAFRQIPYDILWKFDENNLENVSDNVRIEKWFPQRDLLAHPNIKAFVTQGGIQSTDEAIDAGVPLIGIPFVGDQWFNVHRYEELGIGVQLDAFTLTADDIVRGVKTVTSDEKYRQNLKKVKTIMYDTPQTPLERAVWWTEYVIRHKGAQHLKSPAANMSYREYYMVDFVLCVIATLAIALSAVFLTVYYIISLFKPNNVKIKRN